jgi:hypothetical protein
MKTTRRAALPAALLTVVLLGACGGGSGSGSDTGLTPAHGPAGEMPAAETEADGLAADGAARSTLGTTGDVAQSTSGQQLPDYQTRAVISTGTVSLQSDDVAAAKFDLMKVVDTFRGEISDEETATNDDGEVSRSRLVIRVPSDDFDEVMSELSRVPGTDLRSAKRTSEDVTTQVIDTEVRIRAQEKSLQRIELLLARARSIKDIVWIESQLTRRQAELDSLKSQQAFLADQTTLATITVFLEQTPEKQPPEQDRDEAGFLAGLDAGWDALRSAGTTLATVVGALLPFAVLVLVLGLPSWLLLRPLLRRRAPREPVAAD